MRNVFAIWPRGKFFQRFLQFLFDFMAIVKWDIFEVRAELPGHFEYHIFAFCILHSALYCYSLLGIT